MVLSKITDSLASEKSVAAVVEATKDAIKKLDKQLLEGPISKDPTNWLHGRYAGGAWFCSVSSFVSRRTCSGPTFLRRTDRD